MNLTNFFVRHARAFLLGSALLFVVGTIVFLAYDDPYAKLGLGVMLASFVAALAAAEVSLQRDGPHPNRESLAWAALVYLTLILLFAARTVSIAWPGNPFARPLYEQESLTQSIVAVTRGSIELNARARAVLARLPDSGPTPTITADDYDLLQQQAASAAVLITASDVTGLARALLNLKPAPLEPVPSNPREWIADHRGTIANRLLTADHLLEFRMQELRAMEPPAFWTVLCSVRLPKPAPPTIFPPLCARETAALAELRKPVAEDLTKPISRRNVGDPSQHLFGSPELELLILFAALGAIGASTQAIASVAMYLGKRRFVDSWFAFYLTRPLIGAALGPLFYIVLRGGLLGETSSWQDINFFGYGAIAILVGFCATEALEKLRSVASAFFSGKTSRDALDGNAPFIEVVTAAQESAPDRLVIRLSGRNFRPTTQLLLNGAVVATKPEFIASTHIRFAFAKPGAQTAVASPAGAVAPTANPAASESPASSPGEASTDSQDVSVQALNTGTDGGLSREVKIPLDRSTLAWVKRPEPVAATS